MMPYIWLIFHDVACIAAAVTLILRGHPWWAACFVFMAMVTTVKTI